MKKTFVYLLPLLCFLLSLTSCSKESASANGLWYATDIEGFAIKPAPGTPFIQITGNEVQGFTGCNHLSGAIDSTKLASGIADFSGVGATMMECPEDKYETKFLTALAKVRTAEVTATHLTLLGDDAKPVLTFEKQN